MEFIDYIYVYIFFYKRTMQWNFDYLYPKRSSVQRLLGPIRLSRFLLTTGIKRASKLS